MTSSRQTFSRNRRLEGEVRAVLAELLRLSVKDPRLDGVTVSAIQLSADRTKARVFYSVIGDDERERQAADGFAAVERSATGRFRVVFPRGSQPWGTERSEASLLVAVLGGPIFAA